MVVGLARAVVVWRRDERRGGTQTGKVDAMTTTNDIVVAAWCDEVSEGMVELTVTGDGRMPMANALLGADGFGGREGGVGGIADAMTYDEARRRLCF